VFGQTRRGLRGSVLGKYVAGCGLNAAPEFDEKEALERYRRYHALVKQGAILSAHDISEGGLGVTLAEMAFSGKGGIRVDLSRLPAEEGCTTAELLFGETPARLVVEVAPEHMEAARAAGLVAIGDSTREPWLHISNSAVTLIDTSVAELKAIWKAGLTPFY
jgi:phosphoribosylformylglycinamidine synthase